MRAVLLTLAVLLAAPPAAPAAAPRAGVRLLECSPALEPAARSATFAARMRPVRDSAAMAMRFTLQSRGPDAARWRRVDAAGFGTWLPAEPGVRRFLYDKTVRGLPVPASYRVLVRFRWLGPDDEVVARARAASPACAQPDLRPDLVARRLEVLPGPEPSLRRYAVLVRNAGGSEADASVLRVQAGGRPLGRAAVPALDAGEARHVTVTGWACSPEALVAATVDAAATVPESDEADNAVTATCPA